MMRCWWVEAEAQKLGITFRAAEILGVTPERRSKAVEEFTRSIARKVRASDAAASEVLAGYRLLFERVGAASSLAAPEMLLQVMHRAGKLPQVNTVVDVYNAVSLRTLTVISAHDLDRVEGNVRIEMTRGNETFHPLNGNPVTLPPGRWAGVADNHILCFMNCKQSELSKVTFDTRNLLVYVQGNPNTTGDEIAEVLTQTCQEIVRYNSGTVRKVPPC